MIFHLELLPGEKISEPQMSAKLAISRTPVHDALRQLEAEGLVTMGRNKGANVTKLSDEEIQDIGTIRLSQDILSAKLAAYHGSLADFDKLDYYAGECQKAAEKGDVYLRIRYDNDFHLEIARICGNGQLYKQQYSLYQKIYLIHISRYTDIEDSLIQIHHHTPLIQAIRQADMEKITVLTCDHIKDFYQLSPYALKCYDYVPQ